MAFHNNFDAYRKCHVCCAQEVDLINDFTAFFRITSDCRPWTKGGKLGVCRSCGCVQKLIDSDFNNDCSIIYDSYSIYPQGQGQELRVFEQSGGQSQFRSEILLTKVFKQFDLPSKGRLLDVGCGNGNLLRSFSRLHPSWTLAGSELNGKHKQVVKQIENVKAFYSCNVEYIPGQFDIVTMIHCLEHIVDPINFLRKLHDKINQKGFLLIEVPDYEENSFDLIIADHCTHFDIEHMRLVLNAAGFDVLIAANDYIPKELTFLARKSFISGNTMVKRALPSQNVMKGLSWLRCTVSTAANIGKLGNFGMFGTSIAGAWIFSNVGSLVDFFVDEDSSRIGKTFMERPVYHPKDVPIGCNVFIAQPYLIACDIKKRLQSCKAQFHLPPILE